MQAKDTVRMAFGGLRERKTRTALTLLGIIVGSAMLVALESSSEGQTQAIRGQLEKLGPTTLMVRPSQGQSFGTTTLESVLTLDHVASGFLSVTSQATASGTGGTASVSIVGAEPEDLAALVKGLTIESGSVYVSGSLTSALVGQSVYLPPDQENGQTTILVDVGNSLQLSSSTGGRDATTTRHAYTVTGVAAEFGSAPFLDVDNTVFMSNRAAQQMARLNVNQYNQIIVFADDPANVELVQDEIETLLGSGTRVLSGTQIASTVTSIYANINNLLTAVAAISLFVAGVGIANTMFVSVLERTTEIGTLKALGFKGRQVLTVFLMEAGITGLLGGILGAVSGVAMSFGVQRFVSTSTTPTPGGGVPRGGGGGFPGDGAPGGGGFGGGGTPPGGGFGGGGGGGLDAASSSSSPVFTPELFLMVIGFAILIAILAGLIPARKASKLDPVKALKRL